MISKLLIANRGEIAVRIIRTARSMGIRTVAVYSEADAHAMHAALADEAICIGAAEPKESYLNVQRILEAATETGAKAIHPGYGFLSENADFAEACANAGLIFVGPPASAMRRLGAKIDAKQLAVEAGVPIVPGYFEKGASPEKLLEKAKGIGFPVMLKASAGGGGRGMRVVRDPATLLDELATASIEAKNAFGDGAMMVEKLIERPRHVEVQVLADGHGNVAALFERECSIQRRHQKLIEEAPSVVFPGDPASSAPERNAGPGDPNSEIAWQALREAAVSLVRAAGYQNAGTVEFMVDESSGAFYFLEVNARLQVEHPVTEAVTGLDLVAWQLKIASGEALRLPGDLASGDRRALNGHAIEARIVAEDPGHGWLPSTGRILGWAEPKGPGVRVDTGYCRGAEVSRYYDSLLAKVIAHGATRREAIERLKGALLDFHILGVKTNIEHLLTVLEHPEFAAGRFDTGFLDREMSEWSPSTDIPAELGALVVAASGAPSGNSIAAETEKGTLWGAQDSYRNA